MKNAWLTYEVLVGKGGTGRANIIRLQQVFADCKGRIEVTEKFGTEVYVSASSRESADVMVKKLDEYNFRYK